MPIDEAVEQMSYSLLPLSELTLTFITSCFPEVTVSARAVPDVW